MALGANRARGTKLRGEPGLAYLARSRRLSGEDRIAALLDDQPSRDVARGAAVDSASVDEPIPRCALGVPLGILLHTRNLTPGRQPRKGLKRRGSPIQRGTDHPIALSKHPQRAHCRDASSTLLTRSASSSAIAMRRKVSVGGGEVGCC